MVFFQQCKFTFSYVISSEVAKFLQAHLFSIGKWSTQQLLIHSGHSGFFPSLIAERMRDATATATLFLLTQTHTAQYRKIISIYSFVESVSKPHRNLIPKQKLSKKELNSTIRKVADAIYGSLWTRFECDKYFNTIARDRSVFSAR